MKLPRFKLRTIFVLIAVISIPMAWVAYHLNWIRQRHAYMRRYGIPSISYGNDVEPAFPWQLGLFGEKPIRAVLVSEKSLKRAQELFPEVHPMNFWGPAKEPQE